jgi:hypothetical protein
MAEVAGAPLALVIGLYPFEMTGPRIGRRVRRIHANLRLEQSREGDATPY